MVLLNFFRPINIKKLNKKINNAIFIALFESSKYFHINELFFWMKLVISLENVFLNSLKYFFYYNKRNREFEFFSTVHFIL